ncbi:MAG: guanitoxin biosynthesis MBL fold metallo-hydrolase GntH [Planctomycetota bacterium]|jgi:ribonuclease Z
MRNWKSGLIAVGLVGVGIAIGLVMAQRSNDLPLVVPSAHAGGGIVKSPVGTAPDRYVYYPGTESLRPDEIRVICCGSGLPAARRGQAATCWLIECGNGDKFLFDVGTGSMANVAALMIPYQYLDKVFLSHLHTDHFGDLDALWAGGWTAGRPNALRVWGPSGATPEMGTKYALENFLKTFNWDYQTRAFKISPVPGQMEIHEFDYTAENQVVYEENGVTIRSWPAIHAGDGPVSYSLEYEGMRIVFGGDTFPNKWFVKYAQRADLTIHECMPTPEQLREFYNQPPQLAWRASGGFHTSPPAFGKVMSMVRPRQAVAYHFFNEEGTRYEMFQQIRTTYDGPLSMATDMMVWNVTKERITERMAVSADEAWSVPGTAVQPPPKQGIPDPMTDFTRDGELRQQVIEAQGPMMRAFWKKWNVPLSPDVKKAYGVENGGTAAGGREEQVAQPVTH